MQLLDGQASELCNFTLGIVESVRSNLALKTYSNCLIPFMQLKALERFDMTPDMNMDEVISRSHRSFLDCITSDCENARQQVEDDIPGCADNFSTALQRTLKVTSIPAFSILLNLERLNLAVDSLARQAVLFCDSVRSNFQVTSSRRDGKLLNELKIGVASLDLLRIDAVIARATAESYHSLIASVKATVVLCFKQASKLVSAISVGHKTISNTATSGWFHLEGLILNIYEASTFRGGLKDAYNGEFDDLIAEISVVTQALTDHYLGGEDGVAISYRNHDNLKSLYSKKCSVMQLGEVVDGDCVKRVPELRKLSCEIMDSVAFCDSAVAAAATQGTGIMITVYLVLYPNSHGTAFALNFIQ